MPLIGPLTGTDGDASGAAATAQSNAESFATSAVAAETSRAEAAEAAETSRAEAAEALTALYVPSDATGATDMTSELEAFRIANPGRLVRVAGGSVILLANAFSTATTGDILLDFSDCTILYNHMTVNDYAIQCNNVANAGSEVSVSSMAMATVNTDATVTQVTLGSTISGSRFDWVAVYSTDANPAISGGQYGEIFQLLADESSLVLTATRKLNNYGSYATSVKARKLDATRRVYIRGGIVKANGNTEDHSITTRAGGILVQGFVDPLVENVTFDHPWSLCVRFQCCAAPRARDITVRNVGNLAAYNGFTYGVYFYGMNDAGDARNLVVRNGRHAGFTTDGNSASTTTWYAKGIPTNLAVTGVHGYNCHASVVDTHEEGDGIVIDGVQDFYPYQDADISPGFTGLGCQIRASNVTLRNMFVYGGTRGIKVTAIDHGFEDQVTLENINIANLTPTSLSTNLGDVGVTIADQSGLTNKRHVYFDGVMSNVGQGFLVGPTAKLTVRSVTIRRAITLMDAQAGAVVTFAGHAEFDYRNPARSSPAPTPAGITCRSDSPNGGSSVVFLQRPKVIMGATSAPSVLLTESDTTSAKLYYADGVTVYNPSAVTPIALKSGGTTTMSLAAVAQAGVTSAATLTPLSSPVTASTVTAAVGQLVQCDTTSNAITVTLPATGAADQSQVCVKMITQGSSSGVPRTVTVNCASGDHFNVASTGSTSLTLSIAGQGVLLQYDHALSVWYVLADDIPLGQADIRYGATVGTIGSATGTENLTLGTAAVWNVTLAGNTTFAFEGPASPSVQSLTVYVTQAASGGPYSVTWPGSVTWFGGTAPAISTSAASALTVVTLQTINGGTSWYGGIVSNAALPLTVGDGGTGLNALTTYELLAGGTGTTSPVGQIGTGTTGEVLTSNGAGAYPSFQAPSAPPIWEPADQGLLAWTIDPAINGLTSSAPLATAGTLYVMALKLAATATVTNIVVDLTVAGSSLTSGQCFAGLWQGAGGALIGVTASQHTAWAGSTGAVTMALSGGSQTATAGIVYVGVWFNGTTGPTFMRSASTALVNAGPPANPRWATANTGLTTTPPSTLGTLTPFITAYWAALS